MSSRAPGRGLPAATSGFWGWDFGTLTVRNRIYGGGMRPDGCVELRLPGIQNPFEDL